MKISPFLKSPARAMKMEISDNDLTQAHMGLIINRNWLIAFIRNCHDAILSALWVLGAELRKLTPSTDRARLGWSLPKGFGSGGEAVFGFLHIWFKDVLDLNAYCYESQGTLKVLEVITNTYISSKIVVIIWLPGLLALMGRWASCHRWKNIYLCFHPLYCLRHSLQCMSDVLRCKYTDE